MTVEAPAQPRTIRRNAMRQVHQPAAIGILDPADMAPVIAQVIDLVKRNHRGRWCGSFVFIDPECRVYVISEERAVGVEWTRSRFQDFVGRYVPLVTSSADAWLNPTPEGLAEDFADHLQQLGGA